jgi:outer membrane immunogenic protein
MKRAFTLGIGVLALVGSTFTASAADLGARPIGRAPVLAPVVYNWTGFYVGVGLGGRWTESDWTTTCLGPTFLGTAGCPNDVFFPADTRIGNANPGLFDSTGFRVSGYAGFNWQFQNWVLGVEGDFGWADNDETIAGIPGTFAASLGPGVDTASINDKWDASARGRIGYLFAPTALVYVTGGAAWIEKEITATCGGTFPAGWCNNPGGFAETVDDTFFGWTVGGGVEWMLAPSWILRGEYRFTDYGSQTYTFFANAGIPAGIDSFTFDVEHQTHTAYVGLSYLFNWAGR